MEIVLLIFLSGLLINYLVFLSILYAGLKRLPKKQEKIIQSEFVSVIIPFRNESQNILASLESISAQDYPADKFEVIYVNDVSNDDSYEKLMRADKPDNFKVLSISDHSQGRAYKKKAVSLGIENAKGEIIVTTDADCQHDKSWLSSLLSQFDNKTGFVSGPVRFVPENNLFSKVQALEFASLVISGAGLIGIKKPTICNGANLAFRKSLFKSLHGYSDQMHLSSGEDELLMQKISRETDYSVKFIWEKNAVVTTNPNKNLHDFIQQRKRWASKSLFYKDNLLIAKLAMIYLFFVSLIVQLVLAVFLSKIFIFSFIIFLLLKFVFEYKVISIGSDFLFPRKLLKYFFVTEVFQIIYIIIAGVQGVFGNFNWKGRELTR